MAPSSDPAGTAGRGTSRWRPALTGRRRSSWAIALAFSIAGAVAAMVVTGLVSTQKASARPGGAAASSRGHDHGSTLVRQGKRTFRFATFGDQAFWGDVLDLNQAIAGKANGGVGPGLSP